MNTFANAFVFATMSWTALAQTLPPQFVGKIDKIDDVSGTGKIKVQRGQQIFLGGLNAGLSAGDHILTAPKQTVSVQLADGSELMVGPSSDVGITEAKRQGAVSSSLVTVTYGMLRSFVKKVYSDKEQFNVQTPASAMGVRGTDFLVEHDRTSGQTTMHTFDGSVGVAHSMDELKDPAKVTLVQKGTMTAVKQGQTIAVPQKFNYKTLYDHVGRSSPNIVSSVRAHQRSIRAVQRQTRHGSTHKPRRYRLPKGK